MDYSLRISLDPIIKTQIDRNKRMWNFVKKDIATVLATIDFEANIAISTTPEYGFIIDHQASNQRLVIGPDLTFADGLLLCLADPVFLSLVLAVVIRLHKSY